jgi:hypothetical protein
LNEWYGEKHPIRPITHGASGPDYKWGACYEHYQTISALEWLVSTDKINFHLCSKLHIGEGSADAEVSDEYHAGCRCRHCLEEEGVSIWWMVVCPECGNKRCPHASDHRNKCTGDIEVNV